MDVPPCPDHDQNNHNGNDYKALQKIPWLAASYEKLNGVLPLILSNYLTQGGNILEDFPDTPLVMALRSMNFSAVPILLSHVEQNRESYL